MPVITIRGKVGSGAPEIGKKVAERLHIDYIDSKIIAEVALRLNLEEQDILAKEIPPCTLRERIKSALQKGYATGIGIPGAYLPMIQVYWDDKRYLEALTSLFRDLARGHSVVIFGRGSQFILRNQPQTVNVSIVAPFPVRLKRIMEAKNLNEKQARQELIRKDHAVREFDKKYFKTNVEDPVHYDLVINTERCTYPAAVSIIMETLRIKQCEASSIFEEKAAIA